MPKFPHCFLYMDGLPGILALFSNIFLTFRKTGGLITRYVNSIDCMAKLKHYQTYILQVKQLDMRSSMFSIMQKPRYVVLWITDWKEENKNLIETTVDIFVIFHDIIVMDNNTSNKSNCQVCEPFSQAQSYLTQNLFRFDRDKCIQN